MKTILKLNLSLSICSAAAPSLLGTPKRRRLETTSKVGRNASRSRFLHGLGLVIRLGMVFVASPLRAACNLPPIPAPGETVTWTAANSPFQICTDLAIPTRGTVIVEPGVELQFQGHMLTVSGILNVQGQTTNHITITADGNFPAGHRNGRRHSGDVLYRFGGQIRRDRGKSQSPTRLSLVPTDYLHARYSLSLPPVIKLTRCTFSNTQMQITDSYLVLKDSTFTNTITHVLRGYARLLGTNTVDGQPFQILRETFQAIQPLVVDGVHASNVTTAGGISLTGGSFVLGSNNVLQGNLYPVDIEGGLFPSSIVPLTGNTKNIIWAHDGGSRDLALGRSGIALPGQT